MKNYIVNVICGEKIADIILIYCIYNFTEINID